MSDFNRPFLTGKELGYISDAHERKRLSGDGHYTKLCNLWLEQNLGCTKALLTHSCTASLEISAILINIQPGDEVILPSFTFVSTANAFVLRGAIPIFVDINPVTLNIDESLIEAAITDKTKAIVVVHYAGVACDMDCIMKIAEEHNLYVIEDAAQAILSEYKGRPLGSIGHLGCLSFHETKNIISGEGGALLINRPDLVERAEIIREKGTNRSSFLRGQADKYTWVDVGSSYLPGEIIAAFLWAQLQSAGYITGLRGKVWDFYQENLLEIDELDLAITPKIPTYAKHNYHIFYLLLKDIDMRSSFIDYMKLKGHNCLFHYIPLHSSPFGKSFSEFQKYKTLEVTDRISDQLVRLPLWAGMDEHIFDGIISDVKNFFHKVSG